jgi:hypothetical protein
MHLIALRHKSARMGLPMYSLLYRGDRQVLTNGGVNYGEYGGNKAFAGRKTAHWRFAYLPQGCADAPCTMFPGGQSDAAVPRRVAQLARLNLT